MAFKPHFVIDPARAAGAQLRTELMHVPNTLQRPSIKQVFLSSRNDNLQERNARFGRSIAKHASRPLQFTTRLSTPIQHPISMKPLQFVLPQSNLYNIHANYGNDTLLVYRSDQQTTQSVTIPPGNYSHIEEMVEAINTAIGDSWLHFSWDNSRNRVRVDVGEGNTTAPGIVFAQQFGGLAEMLGFYANDHYDPQTGIFLFPGPTYYAEAAPKYWTFDEIFLHVDDHVGGTGRAFSDAPNEVMVANTESGLDQIFQFYQGENSADAIALQNAAPKGFSMACGSASILGVASYEQSIALHNNGGLEGSFLERNYTHHSAQQYNNLLISQLTVSLTNEFGQLLVASPTTEISVKVQFTTAN